jgi:hypothetical protein
MGLSPIQLLEKRANFWGRFFRIWSEKMVRGGVAFLLGFFGFLMCFMVVNRGEFVVECVANVVC